MLLREKFLYVPSNLPENTSIIFYKIRGPRILMAFLVGAGLSIAGCAYQGAFKNPMVSPDILGATAGAGFGAAVSLLAGYSIFTVQVVSFIFGCIAVFLSYIISKKVGNRRDVILILILAGMVIGAMFQAGISLVKYTADPYSKLPNIVFWLMGSLASITIQDVWLFLPPLIIGCIPIILLRWRINLLNLPDEEAEAMGVNVDRLRLVIIVSATLIASSVVAVGGIIGWVGLIIPHLTKTIVGNNYKVLLPTCFITGGAYLLIIDDIARGIAPMEIPLGILTALIGAPFFVYMMYRIRNSSL